MEYTPKLNKFHIQQVVQDEDEVAYTVRGIAEYQDNETEYQLQNIDDDDDYIWLPESYLKQFGA